MNRERFQALAAAYGGALSRWPSADRWPARWFALIRPRASQDILEDARRLDRALFRSPSPLASLELQRTLIESASGLRSKAAKSRSWFPTLLGTGLAAACAAGVGAGFVIGPLAGADSSTSPTDPAEVAASTLGNPIELGDV